MNEVWNETARTHLKYSTYHRIGDITILIEKRYEGGTQGDYAIIEVTDRGLVDVRW